MNGVAKIAAVLGALITVLTAIGWVMNIVALTHVTVWDGLAVARVLGIPIVPLGAVLGWFF